MTMTTPISGSWNIGDFFANPDISKLVDMAMFLHGYCDVFATMLAEKLGYPISAVIGAGTLMHAYCRVDGLYVDVRGNTDDVDEF